MARHQNVEASCIEAVLQHQDMRSRMRFCGDGTSFGESYGLKESERNHRRALNGFPSMEGVVAVDGERSYRVLSATIPTATSDAVLVLEDCTCQPAELICTVDTATLLRQLVMHIRMFNCGWSALQARSSSGYVAPEKKCDVSEILAVSLAPLHVQELLAQLSASRVGVPRDIHVEVGVCVFDIHATSTLIYQRLIALVYRMRAHQMNTAEGGA